MRDSGDILIKHLQENLITRPILTMGNAKASVMISKRNVLLGKVNVYLMKKIITAERLENKRFQRSTGFYQVCFKFEKNNREITMKITYIKTTKSIRTTNWTLI